MEDGPQRANKVREAKEIALYSNSTICMLYREAKDKKLEIEILTQLTGYCNQKIEEILTEGGYIEMKDERKEQILEKYKEELSDHAIGKELGISQSQVSTFLRSQGLPPNGRKFPNKFAKTEEKKEMEIVEEETKEIAQENTVKEVVETAKELEEAAEQVVRKRPKLSEHEANLADESYLKLAVLTLEILKGIWG
jgi:predicted transcriptional regulator